MNLHSTGYSILKYYVWTVFLIPSFWGFTNGNNTIGQLFVSMSLFLYAICSIIISNNELKLIRSYSIIFLLQIAAYTLTLAIRQTNVFITVSFSDYTDITRPILYLTAVSFPFAIKLKEKEIISIVHQIVKASIFIAIFDIVKLLPGSESIMKLYTHLDPNSFNYQRLSGTFAYCYNYGYILIFDLLYILYSFNRRIIWSILVLILIFLTGSRSILISTFIAIILYFILSNKSVISKLLMISTSIIIILIVYSLLSTIEIPIVQDITENIDKFLSIADNGLSSDGSAVTRSRQFELVLNNFSEFPILGTGPQKGLLAPIEIQLGYYLYAWGIIGFIIFIATLCLSLHYAIKNIKNNNREIAFFSKANFIWVITAVFVGFSTPITDQIRVYQIYYLIQGLQFCIYYMSKKSIHQYHLKMNNIYLSRQNISYR